MRTKNWGHAGRTLHKSAKEKNLDSDTHCGSVSLQLGRLHSWSDICEKVVIRISKERRPKGIIFLKPQAVCRYFAFFFSGGIQKGERWPLQLQKSDLKLKIDSCVVFRSFVRRFKYPDSRILLLICRRQLISFAFCFISPFSLLPRIPPLSLFLFLCFPSSSTNARFSTKTSLFLSVLVGLLHSLLGNRH